MYVGGSFSFAGGTYVSNVAKWNGTTWSALGSGSIGTNGIIRAIAHSASYVYIGGLFTVVGG